MARQRVIVRHHRPSALWRALVALAFFVVPFAAVLVTLSIADPLWCLADDPRVIERGGRFLEELETYRQDPIDFERLPVLKHAIAAFEDRGYFSRPGWAPEIRWRSLARALWRNLRGRREGASTPITQLAKHYLRDGRATISDKFVELLFAQWMKKHASRDELLGMYLAAALSDALRYPAVAASAAPRSGVVVVKRFALAQFGVPLYRLSREAQLLLARAPRGLGVIRRNEALSLETILGAKRWLEAEGIWDPSIPSYLDQGRLDVPGSFSFVRNWTDLVASRDEAGVDLDLVRALKAYRRGLANELILRHPRERALSELALVTAQRTLVRSGARPAVSRVHLASVAKLEPLHHALAALGPDFVSSFTLDPSELRAARGAICVRWIWNTAAGSTERRVWAGTYCPRDAKPWNPEPMTFDEAVARSVNTMCSAFTVLVPYLIWQKNPDYFERIVAVMGDDERSAFDSPTDRGIAVSMLARIGVEVTPETMDPRLSYSSLEVAWFRFMNQERRAAGLEVGACKEDVTQVVGNSCVADSLEQIARYVHRRLFAEPGGDRLSDLGTLLAARRDSGTLRYMAARLPDLVFAGKTGTESNGSVSHAFVALSLDRQGVVLAAALVPAAAGRRLGDGISGSLLLRGIVPYIQALKGQGRLVEGLRLAPWLRPAEEERRWAAGEAPEDTP